MFENLKAKVTQPVSGVNFFSFTTDIWTTNVSNESFLSLTAHWITGTFEQKACSNASCTTYRWIPYWPM